MTINVIAQIDAANDYLDSPGRNKLRAKYKPFFCWDDRNTADRTLIELIANGDKCAMQILYARHKVRLYRFILHLMGNPSVAEDLLSEVFLAAWRHADKFQAKSQVSTWLLAIARHKVFSDLRRRSHERLDEHTAASIEDSADNPEVTMHKIARGAIVRKCLGRLSPADREVMNLVYYQDKSIEEVAKIVGAPTNTIKTRMFYARDRLAELLRDAGVDGL
jgi:RNA polymerase sigma-70 factor (ECF subfamily)